MEPSGSRMVPTMKSRRSSFGTRSHAGPDTPFPFCRFEGSKCSHSSGAESTRTFPNLPASRTKNALVLGDSWPRVTRSSSAAGPPLSYTAAHSRRRASMTSRSLRSTAEARSKYRRTKRIAALTENTVAYQMPSRNPKLCRRRSNGLKDIAHSANGLDQFHREVFVHFGPEPVDKNIDYVRLRIEAVIPDVFEDHGLRNNLSRIAKQQFEEGEFPALQFNLLARAGDFPRNQVHFDVSPREGRRLHRVRRSADQRLDAREQFGERKGLRQVIVAACLQSGDAIVYGYLCAQDQNRSEDVILANLSNEGKAIELRKHDVDNHRVVVHRAHHRKPVLAVSRMVHSKAVLLQAFDDER